MTELAHQDAWQCSQCHENIGREYDVCWNCGTSIDGEVDPDFESAVVLPTDDGAELGASFEWTMKAFYVSIITFVVGGIFAILHDAIGPNPCLTNCPSNRPGGGSRPASGR